MEMASDDVLIRFSVVFKKFGLVFNEFLPVVDCLFHIGIGLFFMFALIPVTNCTPYLPVSIVPAFSPQNVCKTLQ